MCLARVDLASMAVSLTWPSNGVDNYMVGVLPTLGRGTPASIFQLKDMLQRRVANTMSGVFGGEK